MSYAIADLHLTQPTATVHRFPNPNVLLWTVCCGSCAKHCKPQPLISLCLAIQHDHAEMHKVVWLEEIAEQHIAGAA